MKTAYYKSLLEAVIVAFVALTLLVVSKCFPARKEIAHDNDEHNQLDFIVEKLVHSQQNGTDMRSEMYLTHHKYFLERLAEMTVDFNQKTYTLNDVCYKPHPTMFESTTTTTSAPPPHFLQTMHSEMRRLSPCLIVSPLNCFFENHLIHAEISRWEHTVQVNRHLRNAYIELVEGRRTDVYVHGNNASEIIDKWADHFRALPRANFSKERFEAVKRWVKSLEPRQSKCADPVRCHNPLDKDNYLDLCTVMQQFNNFTDRHHQRLKFEFDSGDETMVTVLDCIDDKEKFIEWLQEMDLRGILKTMANVSFPDHTLIGNQRCDGLFHDVGSQGLEFFDGSRSFGNGSNHFDSIKTEIVLMTPQKLLDTIFQQRTEGLHGFSPVVTIEWAERLIGEFRKAIRKEADKFNQHLASQKLHVLTETVEKLPEKSEKRETDRDILGFMLVHSLLTLTFAGFVWSWNPFQSALVFSVRALLAVYSFSVLFNTTIEFEDRVLYSFVLSTVANLYSTTRNSFCEHRLSRCVQRKKALLSSRSNFSSLATVDSERRSTRHLCYLMAKFTNFQAAQDAYGDEQIDEFPPLWWLATLSILPLFGAYWYFIDRTVVEIGFSTAVVLFLAAGEEYFIRERFIKERRKIRAQLYNLKQEIEPSKPEGTSWMGVLTNIIHRGKKKETLGSLSSSTYDLSPVKAFTNVLSRRLRFYGIKFTFWMLKMTTPTSFLLNIPSILLILSAAGLFFIPVSRISPQVLTIQNDDVYVDVSVGGVSSEEIEIFKRISHDIDSIGTLHTISDWYKSFERFERRQKHNKTLADWSRHEPINRAITAPLAPTHFRMKYQFRGGSDEQEMVETVKRLDSLLEHFSPNVSAIRASGVVYEHLHQNSVAWSRFAVEELVAAALFFLLFLLITCLFTASPNIAGACLIAFFAVGTRLEVAAAVSFFTLDHRHFYTDFAVFVGFLCAWTPFCELCRFRGRVLYAKETRTSPELATRRRIRVPFIAAVDVFHHFSTLLAVQLLLLPVFLLVPKAQVFFTPALVLISTELLAVFNAIAVVVSTRQMFERDVRQSLQRDLRGATTSVQLFELSHKLLTPPYEEPPIELDVIKPKSPEVKVWAPKRAPKRPKSEEKETEDDQPGPSSRRINFDSFDLESQVNPDFKWQLPADRLLPNDPHHYILCGPPVDFRIQYPQQQRRPDVRPNPIEQAEELYEMDDSSDFEDNLQEEDEEEEDVHSSGEPDEEVLRVEAEMRKRKAARDAQHDVPGPSHQATLGASDDEIEEAQEPEPTGSTERYVTGRELPPMIERVQPRNPLTEPPVMEEYIQENDDPSLPPHPRADQYPSDWSRAMVAYAEDRFWRERIVPLPAGLQVPPRPRDYWTFGETTPPPEDFNWTAPAEAPPIFIPPEAHALFEERRREHFREQGRDRE